ncbi:MAG TPA: hypothetical protein VF463_13790 [Sphingobium sp.]
MKIMPYALMSAAAVMVAAPVMAQTAAKPAAPAAPAAPVAKHLTTTDTAIGDLLADPAAKAVIDKHIPGLSDSPQIGMASGMTLRAIQPMAGDMITVPMLDAVDTDLAKLPSK